MCTHRILIPTIILGLGFVIGGSISAEVIIISADQVAQQSQAVENSPVVERDGNDLTVQPPGLERIFYVHYQEGFGPEPAKVEDKEASKCYDLLKKGTMWRDLPMTIWIDPDNEDGLSEAFVIEEIMEARNEWDFWTGTQLFSPNYFLDYNCSWDFEAPDGRNELLFGPFDEPGVLAITAVWGVFSGPPETREIREFDILFNSYYSWADTTVWTTGGRIDFRNLATHEFGHGLGLDDLYKKTCTEETMYAYSFYGETKKRTLSVGDILGIQELYGP